MHGAPCRQVGTNPIRFLNARIDPDESLPVLYFSTLKEAPADAEVVSHQLMMRAGMIKKLGAGIYTYMPMGLRVIRKVEAIVREEMNRAGAIECTMPVVQPAELWQETGRFEKMGPELLRIQDRHDAISWCSPPAKKWSPTSRARSCAATSSCPRTCTRSRPSSATSAGPALA
jgi:hypothetical protein